MSRSKKYAFSGMLLAMALVLTATASSASAQTLFRGTVDLPVETHWAGAVLHPGAYTLTIESAPTGMQFIHMTGRDGRKTILTGAFEHEPISGNGSLSLVNVNGSYSVKRFNAGVIGTRYDFRVPKLKPSQNERSSAQPETVVSIGGTQ